MIHAKTRKKSIINELAANGLSITYNRVIDISEATGAYAHQALFSLWLRFPGADLLEFHTKSSIPVHMQEVLFQMAKHYETRIHIFAKNIVLVLWPNGQVFEYQNAY